MGQQFHCLIDRLNRVDVKLSIGDGFSDVLTKHQISDIGCGNDDALVSGKASQFARIEEGFDLFINAADAEPVRVGLPNP
jgi:hypothetical protein